MKTVISAGTGDGGNDMDDRTYCSCKCDVAGKCDRHYTNHLTGDPNHRMWMAEWRIIGRAGEPCQYFEPITQKKGERRK